VDLIDWALLAPVEGAARSRKQIRYAQADDDRDQNRDELKLADLTWHGRISRRIQPETEVRNRPSLSFSGSNPRHSLALVPWPTLGAGIGIDA
jgi:hypothetical protein